MSKRTVRYVGKAVALPVYEQERLIGVKALLVPMDHDGPNVVNDMEAITSFVRDWNHDTGRIETDNSVYIPVTDPLELLNQYHEEQNGVPA